MQDLRPQGRRCREKAEHNQNTKTLGEHELDECGQEGVRVDEKEKRALEVRRHVTKVNVLVLLVTAL